MPIGSTSSGNLAQKSLRWRDTGWVRLRISIGTSPAIPWRWIWSTAQNWSSNPSDLSTTCTLSTSRPKRLRKKWRTPLPNNFRQPAPTTAPWPDRAGSRWWADRTECTERWLNDHGAKLKERKYFKASILSTSTLTENNRADFDTDFIFQTSNNHPSTWQ
jgi:hypothetical protein